MYLLRMLSAVHVEASVTGRSLVQGVLPSVCVIECDQVQQ
jgi:hypothetical protein